MTKNKHTSNSDLANRLRSHADAIQSITGRQLHNDLITAAGALEDAPLGGVLAALSMPTLINLVDDLQIAVEGGNATLNAALAEATAVLTKRS